MYYIKLAELFTPTLDLQQNMNHYLKGADM